MGSDTGAPGAVICPWWAATQPLTSSKPPCFLQLCKGRWNLLILCSVTFSIRCPLLRSAQPTCAELSGAPTQVLAWSVFPAGSAARTEVAYFQFFTSIPSPVPFPAPACAWKTSLDVSVLQPLAAVGRKREQLPFPMQNIPLSLLWLLPCSLSVQAVWGPWNQSCSFLGSKSMKTEQKNTISAAVLDRKPCDVDESCQAANKRRLQTPGQVGKSWRNLRARCKINSGNNCPGEARSPETPGISLPSAFVCHSTSQGLRFCLQGYGQRLFCHFWVTASHTTRKKRWSPRLVLPPAGEEPSRLWSSPVWVSGAGFGAKWNGICNMTLQGKWD